MVQLRNLGNVIAKVLLTAAGLAALMIASELIIRYRIIGLDPLTPEGHVDTAEMARRAALSRGEPYDGRPVHEVIAAARSQGKRSYPAVSPAFFIDPKGSSVEIDQHPVLPMGITARAVAFYCNESGKYAEFKTDRYGFRNPDSVWEGPPDMVVVGDSYTMGSCVSDDESIVGNLRSVGTKVINLGMGANGPLIELGSLIEYGRAVKPKKVVWMFFPNDLDDLERDSNNPILKSYLKTGFSQHLMDRAAELNPAIDAVVERYWVRVQEAGIAQDKLKPPSFLEFSSLRKSSRFLAARYLTPAIERRPNLKLFLDVLKRAESEAQAMGAPLLFVYLPDCGSTSYGQHLWKAGLLSSVQELGIPVIDIEPATKALADAGKSAWFYCPDGHFNPTGAKAAAEQIAGRLAEAWD